ncbi:MAG: tetratricopeptide repeat protein [Nitrospirae bacterium]|nr:tetratricopeptide repeat protein [Nitrospirota bacterium]
MGKIIVLFVLLFLCFIGVLAYFNHGTVTLTVWKDISFTDIPIMSVILISTAAGFFSMFIVAVTRDAKRYIDNWHEQRRQKRELKLEENYAKGLNAFHALRFDEAAELMSRVIDEEPRHANALLRMGDVCFGKGDLAAAKDYYSKAEAVSPRDIEVLLSLEKVFEKEQKWQEALKYLNRIIEIDEGSLMALRKKRDIFERNKRWADLIEVQSKILRADLSEAEMAAEENTLIGYRYELAQKQIEVGNTDKAVKILKSIIRTDKEFGAAYIALADAYLKEEKDGEARDILVKGYEVTSSPVFLVKLEDILLSMGEPDKIIDFYIGAVEEKKSDPKIQFFLAKLYSRLVMIDDALQTLNNIDSSSFDPPDMHVLLGNIYERRGEYKLAAEEFKKAIKVEKPFVIPFCCSRCGYTTKKWAGRCPQCKNWNGLVFNLNGVCKA